LLLHLLGFLEPEDEGTAIPENVGNYTASHLRRLEFLAVPL
jgi:hypothetical protein